MRHNRPRRNKFRSNDRGFKEMILKILGVHGINSASKIFKEHFLAEMILKPKNY
jgi:hypothetical protein